MSSKFGFILVKPQLGENIGACARAMKNFGFSKLHIVEPKINFPNHKAKATSVGAYDIINKAKVFNNIQDAIEPFNLVISLSARRRDINKKNISLKEFQKIIPQTLLGADFVFIQRKILGFLLFFKSIEAKVPILKILKKYSLTFQNK